VSVGRFFASIKIGATSNEMLALLTPHLQLDSVVNLSPEHLHSINRVGLLLDVDCTLKDHGAPAFPPSTVEWIRLMKSSGLRMCLLSNGKARRIEPLARTLQIPFVAKAFKPFPFGCRAALRLLDLPSEQCAIVGDQIFADVLAGQLARLFTVLVRPTSPIEPIWTRIKRPFERLVLKRIASRTPSLNLVSHSIEKF
jgi:HAD superfamily phosphatase (TIGR01668 family)